MIDDHSTHTTPKRWRPRFSVRTLVILVTLVCCYAACWGPTKTQGVKDVMPHINNVNNVPQADDLLLEAGINRGLRELFGPWLDASAAMPLLVQVDEVSTTTHSRRYYFWFFGYVAKLPYERDLPPRKVWRIRPMTE